MGWQLRDAIVTTGGSPVLIPVDPCEGARLELTIAVAPEHGSAVVAGGSVVYAPHPGFVGLDSFAYEVRDPGGGCARASILVTVTPGRTAPRWTPSRWVPG